MKFCPTCKHTEDDEEPGLVNLHHVYPPEGSPNGRATHHTAEEHAAS